MSELPTEQRRRALAKDLTAVRRRGVTEINRQTHNQAPLVLPELEPLARAWRPTAERVEALRALIQAALDAYEVEDAREAATIRGLYFTAPTERKLLGPGALLKQEQTRSGQNVEAFEIYRSELLGRFAGFLLSFADPASAPATGAGSFAFGGSSIGAGAAPPPSVGGDLRHRRGHRAGRRRRHDVCGRRQASAAHLHGGR